MALLRRSDFPPSSYRRISNTPAHGRESSTLGRRSPQLLQQQMGHRLSASTDDASTPETLSGADAKIVEASESTPLVEGKEESGGKEFTAAFYRTRLITFGAMVTGRVSSSFCGTHIAHTQQRTHNSTVVNLQFVKFGLQNLCNAFWLPAAIGSRGSRLNLITFTIGHLPGAGYHEWSVAQCGHKEISKNTFCWPHASEVHRHAAPQSS